MKIPTVGTIGSIALLGGIGYAAYKFLKGDWKIPTLPTLPPLPPLPTPAPETGAESGLVGQIGDIIYNITNPDLRERAITEYLPAEKETERIIYMTTPGGEIPPPPDPEGVFARGVARTVSKDIIGGGLPKALLFAPWTIGAGLGAITQQGKWMGTLPDDARKLAEQEESRKRLELQTTPEGIIATALMPPFISIPLAISDVIRGTRKIKITPPPKPKATVPEVKEQVQTVLRTKDRTKELIDLARMIRNR